MPWIKTIIPFYQKIQNYVLLTNVLLISALLLSCDIPEETFTPPAIVFFPDKIETKLGEYFLLDVYALELDSVGGAQIEINYNASSLSVSAVSKGNFFQGGNDPIFVSENNNGKLVIYVTYMGPEGATVSGTGNIATIAFLANIRGKTTLTISDTSVLLDKDANPIQINGLGQGVVGAK